MSKFLGSPHERSNSQSTLFHKIPNSNQRVHFMGSLYSLHLLCGFIDFWADQIVRSKFVLFPKSKDTHIPKFL